MNKKKYTKQKSDINYPNKLSHVKIILISIFIIILMIALLGRIAYLQFVQGEFLQTSATTQKILTETISAKRGTIYDATGDVLALSYETDKIYGSILCPVDLSIVLTFPLRKTVSITEYCLPKLNM